MTGVVFAETAEVSGVLVDAPVGVTGGLVCRVVAAVTRLLVDMSVVTVESSGAWGKPVSEKKTRSVPDGGRGSVVRAADV